MSAILFMEKWQEELMASIRTVDDLKVFVRARDEVFLNTRDHRLSGNFFDRLFDVVARARMSITPHTAKLIDWGNPDDPLFLMSVPNEQELEAADNELDDPVGDKICSPLPFLVRKYEDRALIQVSFVCPQYCRFCFRRDRTGRATAGPTAEDRERIREYLVAHAEIKEVILSGGEPLLLTDSQLREWFEMIRAAGKSIRVHSRVPVTLPSRITPELVSLLSEFKTTIVTHFNHPKEIAAENTAALRRLTEAGLVVKNQSVLLRGVNDSTEIFRELIERLRQLGVSQWAIHHLDAAKGTGHFYVPLARGIEIVRVLGKSAPPYQLDMPDGKGKINILSAQRSVNGLVYSFERNGELVEYVDWEK